MVQVNKAGSNEMKIFKAALNLQEAGFKDFDKCVEVLRQCNCDENAALQMLIELKKEWSPPHIWGRDEVQVSYAPGEDSKAQIVTFELEAALEQR